MKKELKTFDNPRNVTKFLRTFYIFLAVLLMSDFFIHKHADFPWEGWPWFFAAFGFISCGLLVFMAKILKTFIQRDEGYYD